MTECFFEGVKEQSKVKAAIVTKYFSTWARIMKSRAVNERLFYLDLFSGPGCYEDGTESTPLIVLRLILKDDDLKQMMLCHFNDKDTECTEQLKKEIDSLEGIKELKFKPMVSNFEVDDEAAKHFENTKLIPTLSFIDPFGYKGVQLKLISALVRDWGSDCFLFFNYRRINMAITNPVFKKHVDALFGKKIAKDLREKAGGMSPNEREQFVLDSLAVALRDKGAKHVVPFRFIAEDKDRTSHHLIFITKHPLAFGIAKDIMSKASTEVIDGVGSFEFNPQPLLSGLSFFASTVDDLAEELLEEYSGRTITAKEIYYEHHLDNLFVLTNYKDALGLLEEAGKIEVVRPPRGKKIVKGKLTYGDKTTVTFP